MAKQMEELSKILSNAIEKIIEKYKLNTIKRKLEQLAGSASQISKIKESLENIPAYLSDMKKKMAEKNAETEKLQH